MNSRASHSININRSSNNDDKKVSFNENIDIFKYDNTLNSIANLNNENYNEKENENENENENKVNDDRTRYINNINFDRDFILNEVENKIDLNIELNIILEQIIIKYL